MLMVVSNQIRSFRSSPGHCQSYTGAGPPPAELEPEPPGTRQMAPTFADSHPDNQSRQGYQSLQGHPGFDAPTNLAAIPTFTASAGPAGTVGGAAAVDFGAGPAAAGQQWDAIWDSPAENSAGSASLQILGSIPATGTSAGPVETDNTTPGESSRSSSDATGTHDERDANPVPVAAWSIEIPFSISPEAPADPNERKHILEQTAQSESKRAAEDPVITKLEYINSRVKTAWVLDEWADRLTRCATMLKQPYPSQAQYLLNQYNIALRDFCAEVGREKRDRS